MSTLVLNAAKDDFSIHTSNDVVSLHLRNRRRRRSVVAGAAGMAAIVLALTLYQGYEVSRPVPDLVTFAFRV